MPARIHLVEVPCIATSSTIRTIEAIISDRPPLPLILPNRTARWVKMIDIASGAKGPTSKIKTLEKTIADEIPCFMKVTTIPGMSATQKSGAFAL